MSDVFILGAGFSKAISDAMPVLNDLSVEVKKRLPELEEVAAFLPDNIEVWLTYLSQKHPWLSEAANSRNHALLLDVSESVHSILADRMSAPLAKARPDWLSELVTLWNKNASPVLTLNYDTLVERCVCEVSGIKKGSWMVGYSLKESVSARLYPIPLTPTWQRSAARRAHSGDPSSLLSLFKLHGSTNWFYSGAPNANDETIYFVPATEWVVDDPGERYAAGTYPDKVPFIVPPLIEKLPYFGHALIRSLWAMAGSALRSASRIFCLGYSLPETDITMRFFLQSNRPQNPVPLFLVNKPNATDPHLVARFRSLSEDRYKIDARFLLDENPISALVKELVHGGLKQL
jgi:hypothetical protein